ncbi:acyl-CoA carboxylase epsilon subunit [Nocardia camponoti]|uniref:Acyl-CoA carboxylase subunit epsilon n=1 Tax=Nocardia camponoti TaxID=1616106 RepID=A0A917VAK7_9NOCA|nr:acyl-CoA carboxylase epsilon subunit [Nocardia camponoti]GGK56300.1 hypothetical protein GCM10011591_30420 [Nocardia camponoti]
MTTVAEEDVLTAAELELDDLGLVEEVESIVDALIEAQPSEPQQEPMFRVLKGSPTDEDVAALVAVFAAASAQVGAAVETGPTDNWGVATLSHRGVNPFSPYAYPLLSHLR